MEMKRQTDIYHEQLFEEMILDGFLSDRSTLDNAAYLARAIRKHHKDIGLDQYFYIFDCIREAKKHAETYDHMFYIPKCFQTYSFLNTNYPNLCLSPPNMKDSFLSFTIISFAFTFIPGLSVFHATVDLINFLSPFIFNYL